MEVNTDEEPLVLKAQLFALTGVQPHRQKVMVKGQVRRAKSMPYLAILVLGIVLSLHYLLPY